MLETRWILSLTWRIERHSWVSWEKRWVVRMKWWSTVSKVEFITGKVGKAGLVKSARRQIHGKAAHLSRATEERSTTHARELLKSALFWSFVLEPDLWTRQQRRENVLVPFSCEFNFPRFLFPEANHKVDVCKKQRWIPANQLRRS